MPKGLPKLSKNFLSKARDAALTAVANYNNPYLTFRSATFISHMQIAWTALFLAMAIKEGKQPYQKDKHHPTRYLRIRNRRRCWSLEECISVYYPSVIDEAVKTNLLFLKELRDMIEHDEMPMLDLQVFGECQASLFNFESLLVSQFGEKYALNASLAAAVQFSRSYTDPQLKALRQNLLPLTDSITDYIRDFRSSLSPDVFNSQTFSYKVFLVPNTVPSARKEAVAVQFINYDSLTPEEKERYDFLPHLVKNRDSGQYPFEPLKPKDVIRLVRLKRSDLTITDPMHRFMSLQLGIRPPKSATEPNATDRRFCCYDQVSGRYVFSAAWVNKICDTLPDVDAFNCWYANSCKWHTEGYPDHFSFDSTIRRAYSPPKTKGDETGE